MSLWRNRLTQVVGSDEKSPPAEEISGSNTALPHTENAELDAVHIVQPGDLSLEEDTAGGLGRHLGLFSTTFLMCVVRSSQVFYNRGVSETRI